MAAKYLVKSSTCLGTYSNPYKKGGRAMAWGKWKTISKHDSLEEALAAAVVRVGLARRAVFYKGVKLSEEDRLLKKEGGDDPV